MVDTPPDTIFNVVRPQDERFVFVLDVSRSMELDGVKRLTRLIQSSTRWVRHEVRDGSWVGATSFRYVEISLAFVSRKCAAYLSWFLIKLRTS